MEEENKNQNCGNTTGNKTVADLVVLMIGKPERGKNET